MTQQVDEFTQAFQLILDTHNEMVDTNNSLVEAIENQDKILAQQNTAMRIQEDNEKKLRDAHTKDGMTIKRLSSTNALLQIENKKVNQLNAENKKLKNQVTRTKASNVENTAKATRLEGKVRELEKAIATYKEKIVAMDTDFRTQRAESAWQIYGTETEMVFVSPTKVEVDGEEQRTLLFKKNGTGIMREVGLKDLQLTVGGVDGILEEQLPVLSEDVYDFMLTTLLEMKRNNWSYLIA